MFLRNLARNSNTIPRHFVNQSKTRSFHSSKVTSTTGIQQVARTLSNSSSSNRTFANRLYNQFHQLPNDHPIKDLFYSGLTLVKFGCFLYVVNTYLFEVIMCIGPSMMPTFNAAGDIVVVEHISPRYKKLQVGDIVVSKSPSNPNQTVCKRIVGFGGDKIKTAKRFPGDTSKKIKVPTGYVWLEGDNHYNSNDSRSYGPIPRSMIKGKVFLKLWPLYEMKYYG